MLKDTLGPKKITDLEIEYAADTRYEDKYKARKPEFSNTDLSARSLK